MKKIAVLSHTIVVEYTSTIAKGIASFFTDKKDYQIYFVQTGEPHYSFSQYDYQHWASAEIIKALEFDLYIVISSSYCTNFSRNELADLIRPLSHKPIVSIGLDLPLGDVKFTSVDVDSAYLEVVNHLKNNHNCKKIGFMNANRTGSREAKNRSEAFEKAMKICNLPLNKNCILDGAFSIPFSYNLILNTYKSKDEIPFDALICSNDLMALGSINAFKKLGVRVPQDIKVIGFDDTSHAYTTNPTITTINQKIKEQGEKGAEIAWKILEGETCPVESKTQTQVKYRQSCGCVCLKNKNLYKTRALNLPVLLTKKQKIADNKETIPVNLLDDICRVYEKNLISKDDNEIQEFEGRIKRFGISSLYLCLYPAPIICKREDNFELPDSAILKLYIDEEKEIKTYYKEGITFNPHQKILPDVVEENSSGNFFIHPVYSDEIQYGYFVGKTKNTNFSTYAFYLKVLANLIINNSKDKFNLLKEAEAIADAELESDK